MQKVSLLVTTYNVAVNLPLTLASIARQDYGNLEVVIVDGGSTDGTIDCIREFAGMCETDCRGRTVVWTSEPDKGLYDAMNKAYRKSSGDIIAICNDELTTPQAVSKLVQAIEKGGDNCVGAHADLVYAQDGKVIRSWKMGQGKITDGWMPGHPTLFLKREIYEKYGLYDSSYTCAADYEFMVRFLKDERNEIAYVPEVLVSMFYGGTSNAGLSNYLVSFREAYRALKSNQVPHPLRITLKRTCKVLKQF